MEMPALKQADELALLVQKNLTHLQPWMPWAVDNYGKEHAETWIKMTRDEFASSGSFNSVILLNEECIGTIGFHALDNVNRKAEIGYWINKEYEGRGIITKCCRVLINYLFDKLELNRVQINCNVNNVKSRAVPERLGFTLEGKLREVELLNGRFGDWAIYGMLRSEWTMQNRISEFSN